MAWRIAGVMAGRTSGGTGRRIGRGIACAVFGLAIGFAITRFAPSDYYHRFLPLKEGAKETPLYIQDVPGKKLILLTIKNLQQERELVVKVSGGRLTTSIPPPLPLQPSSTWAGMKGDLLTGLHYGMRIPAFVMLEDAKEYELTFARPSDGSIIKRIPIIKGESHGQHH